MFIRATLLTLIHINVPSALGPYFTNVGWHRSAPLGTKKWRNQWHETYWDYATVLPA